MVKKKSVKKPSKKRVVRKKPIRKIKRVSGRSKNLSRAVKSAKMPARKKPGVGNKKFNIVLKNLILFLVLFALSMIFYNFSKDVIYEQLFFLLSLLFGFVSIAFLIALLIFVILRMIKK